MIQQARLCQSNLVLITFLLLKGLKGLPSL